LRISSADR